MGEIYKNPLRVYIVLGLLGLWGILAGFSLPISLFPNISKPKINVSIPYGNLAVEDFYKSYGSKIENQLKGTIIDGKTISDMTAEYGKSSVRIRLEFEWGVAGEKALNEIEST